MRLVKTVNAPVRRRLSRRESFGPAQVGMVGVFQRATLGGLCLTSALKRSSELPHMSSSQAPATASQAPGGRFRIPRRVPSAHVADETGSLQHGQVLGDWRAVITGHNRRARSPTARGPGFQNARSACRRGRVGEGVQRRFRRSLFLRVMLPASIAPLRLPAYWVRACIRFQPFQSSAVPCMSAFGPRA